ncbi:MAG: FAD-binding oxidoreductase [Actinomycetota bacterium]
MTDRMAKRIAVVGGGMAGVSAAYALAGHPSRPSVTLLEAEAQLAHHTTGRSAAQLILNYGAMPVRPLTAASLPFFHNPPPDLCDEPLLTEQGVLTLAHADQDEIMDERLASGLAINPNISELSVAEAAALFPPLRTETITRVIYEQGSFNIDVSLLHQAFVRGLRGLGGEIAVLTRMENAVRPDGGNGWTINTTDGPRHADVVVNAAGAWGDVVAAGAGVQPVGLIPKRRTAFMVASLWPDSASWPMAAEAELAWYLKPDGPQFLCSPGDETPSEPVDAKPEEADVALAIDRINADTTLDIRSVRSSWAGLRTFTEDGSMVIGPDPEIPSFVWSVGQGGTGIQTAPAAGRLVADLCLDGAPSAYFDGVGLDLTGLSPDRLRS